MAPFVFLAGVGGMVEVASVKTDANIPRGTFEILLELASPEKRKRAERISHRINAINTLVGELLAREMVAAKTGAKNDDLFFLRGPGGKPYLRDFPGLHFNISHSGDLVVCALSDRPVGIDVEKPGTLPSRITRRFFSRGEIDCISNAQDKYAAFYKIWTMKESYLKLKGEGSAIPLASFCVLEIAKRGEAFFYPIEAREDAACHLCTESQGEVLHKGYSLSELLNRSQIVENGSG